MGSRHVDPVTAFIIATLMMLLNGGVLGLVHRDLPDALRPAAKSWRIATLLLAGGCVLLATQAALPIAFVLPLANGMLLLGLTGYWRALRQFDGIGDSYWLLLPAAIGTAGIWWFAASDPSLVGRVLVSATVWLVLIVACIRVLYAGARADTAISRRVLAAIFVLIGVFMAGRLLYFPFVGETVGSILDRDSWMNMITPMVAAILPVVGTTAFLQLCSERIRRDWERAASTDYLTGLANRRTLAQAGARELHYAREQGGTLSVAVIDIDHFKRINDRFGHDVGDLALRQVAEALRAACRAPDIPARQGGEEFVVLMPGHDIQAAMRAAQALSRGVREQTFEAPGESLQITVSIGVATLSPQDQHLDDLLRRADNALYAAKTAGRDRVMAV